MKIKRKDVAWLKKHYAGLRVKDKALIVGILRFRARKASSKAPDKVLIYHELPSREECCKRFYIEDTYKIELQLDEKSWPRVRETGGRLEARAKKLKWELIDLHVYPETGEVCLGSPPLIVMKMQEIKSLDRFFDTLLIPYFYYQSFWEKYGTEPWPGLSHGDVGILEDLPSCKDYMDNTEFLRCCLELLSESTRQRLLLRKEIGPNEKCFCDSGNEIRHCHPKAREGFNILVSRINEANKFRSTRIEIGRWNRYSQDMVRML